MLICNLFSILPFCEREASKTFLILFVAHTVQLLRTSQGVIFYEVPVACTEIISDISWFLVSSKWHILVEEYMKF